MKDKIVDVLSAVLNEVAFKTDENDDNKNISIIGKAENRLKIFLENTDLSDTAKATHYTSFLTTTTSNAIQQAIMIAGQAPLQETQISTMSAESTQKIASMVADDTNKLNETTQRIESMKADDKMNSNNTAVNIAKAKAEIESVIPADVAIKQKQLEVFDADISHKGKIESSLDAEITLRGVQGGLESARTVTEGYNASMAIEQIKTERQKVVQGKEQIKLTGAELEYRKEQTIAMSKATEINKEIEQAKNDTQIEIELIRMGL
ncbi:MAG: hypothetical protein U9N42_06650 [Campylobacterota bacterium]|nr:hypothetical protein [Campylobacterota bacterium]